MSKSLNGLLTSRKFWLAVVAALAAIVLYVQGQLDANALADALVALAAIVIGAIAAEDAAAKWQIYSKASDEVNDGQQ